MRKRDIKDAHTEHRGASGRFVLRLDPALHARLREDARRQGKSLNACCADRLAQGRAGLSSSGAAAAVVNRARLLMGGALVGIVAYGSWAHGETVVTSDVDVLVVLETRTPIRRALYRRWDEAPVEWEGREVEPHFVALPGPDDPVAGLWTEAAIDGIVLCDDTLRVSARLVRVRHDVLEGRIVRRTSHGQPYWVFPEVD